MPIRFIFCFFSLFLVHKGHTQKPLSLTAKTTSSFKNVVFAKDSAQLVSIVINVADSELFEIKYQGFIQNIHKSSNTYVLKMPASYARKLVTDSNVLFMDALRKPIEELTTGSLDINLNKINFTHHLFPSLNGKGIHASVKEQLFDSTDMDFKGRYFNSGVAATTTSTHATIMATMLGGGGNSSPNSTGAAPGVGLTSSSFTSLLPDSDEVYRQNNISVQSHSYGTDIENFYGADARAYDINVLQNPHLVHVFSSGNKGASTPSEGTYAGIEGFANLTGSFKMAKNIITVGAVDSFNTLMQLSSKGPAYDGRVKPELVAFGQDGSSGSAALVAGTAAVLQQAYQVVKGKLPASYLIKSVLINSADDKGVDEVDYQYGFGSLNAYHALTTVLEQRFIEDSVNKRDLKRFTIQVPQGIAKLKVSLVWNDAAAEANATKALVNDLDATVSFEGITWHPWILNHSANKSALMAPANRGKDTLNNVEQITINNPKAGSYTFTVDGRNLVDAVQPFAVAYQFDTASTFKFTFPTATNSLAAGTKQFVRWQTTFNEPTTLEYSINGGDWQLIQPQVDAAKAYAAFTVPDTAGYLLFKATFASNQKSITSDTISFAPELQLNVGLNCQDSFMLFWPSADVSSYQLYKLGDKYMEPFAITTDTFMVLKKGSNPQLYYAVAPRIYGKNGYRSTSINYTLQGVACYFRSFYAFKSDDKVQLQLELGSLFQIEKIEFQVLNSQKGFETFFTDSTPATTVIQVIHAAPKTGINQYRVAITLTNGAVVYSEIVLIYHFTNQPIIVYPNPARQNEAVYILAQDIDFYSIQIVDANGRTVFTKTLEDNKQSIPPLRFSKGVYFIRTWSDEKSYQTQKLVVY